MSLTNTTIRSVKPARKRVKLFDERGLYLEISPSGGKWWRLKYRYESKEKRLSLGVFPDVSLKDARDRRDAARKLLGDGVDPSENRKAQKSAQAERAANSFKMWRVSGSPNILRTGRRATATGSRYLSVDRWAANCRDNRAGFASSRAPN